MPTTITTTTTMTTVLRQAIHPKKLVCFSFAAYARTLIGHLRSAGIPVLPGLTEDEFASVESILSLTFPPDLRLILQEGLPIGTGFPDWRCSSPQQLQLFTRLPRLTIRKLVCKHGFWCTSWGDRPDNDIMAGKIVDGLMDKAPPLVPVFRNCYVSSRPGTVGGPVFYIDDSDIRLLSFDLAGFFRDNEFTRKGGLRACTGPKIVPPTWIATAPQKIEFWSGVVEEARLSTKRWWGSRGGKISEVLDEAFWRLRNGGWRLDEVKEMMMVIDSSDAPGRKGRMAPPPVAAKDMNSVVQHVTALSRELLRAGWSTEEVMDSLGIIPFDEIDNPTTNPPSSGDDSCDDFRQHNDW